MTALYELSSLSAGLWGGFCACAVAFFCLVSDAIHESTADKVGILRPVNKCWKICIEFVCPIPIGSEKKWVGSNTQVW